MGRQIFDSYKEFNRDQNRFEGCQTGTICQGISLENDIFINDNEYPAGAIIFHHTSDPCRLFYKCLPDWSYASTQSLQLAISDRLTEINSAPDILDICETSTNGDMLLFINGYDLFRTVPNFNELSEDEVLELLDETEELVNTASGITYHDVHDYWTLTGDFINRLKPSVTLFADGHNSITTSNHAMSRKSNKRLKRSKALRNFGRSLTCMIKDKKDSCLNDTYNDAGFRMRMDSGRNSAEVLISKINTGEIVTTKSGLNIDQKLDIVAHSFGYAHALGLIERLIEEKGNGGININFGRFYILAPENPATAASAVDLGKFDQVFQYGSSRYRNENTIVDNRSEDPPEEQDGVAPQAGIPAFNNIISENLDFGRSFIPVDWHKKGFNDSHSSKYYDWIFKRLKKGDRGYVEEK